MQHEVVSHEKWIEARKVLLAKEKEFTRLRDELSSTRRDLPWEKVEKNYTFEGPNGRETLADLFGERSQLFVYHFMFGAGWKEGCPSCSFIADHFDGLIPHLGARDITLAAISRGPLPELQAFQQRMGWRFKWLSSAGTDFNDDYGVVDVSKYNYGTTTNFKATELPGASVFYKDESGQVFHTYSTYARGLDILLGAYNFIDMTPKGRDEAGHGMSWVKHHDKYEHAQPGGSCCH